MFILSLQLKKEDNMQVIKKLGVFSVGKISALLGFAYGLIAGILMAIASGVIPASANITGTASTLMIGWKAVLILPILYAIGYFIMGILFAIAYNLLARWVGGIKITLEDSVEYTTKEIRVPIRTKTKAKKA